MWMNLLFPGLYLYKRVRGGLCIMHNRTNKTLYRYKYYWYMNVNTMNNVERMTDRKIMISYYGLIRISALVSVLARFRRSCWTRITITHRARGRYGASRRFCRVRRIWITCSRPTKHLDISVKGVDLLVCRIWGVTSTEESSHITSTWATHFIKWGLKNLREIHSTGCYRITCSNLEVIKGEYFFSFKAESCIWFDLVS